MAYSDPFIANAAIEPPANVGTRSRDRSNIGWLTRPSTTRKAASKATPAARQMITPVLDQEVSPARINPYTKPIRPAGSSTKPGQSGGAGCGERDSVTRQTVTASANTPTGTLTRKMPPQSQSVVITPPSTGPSAEEIPTTAPHTPKATPRSRPRKLFPRSASDVANIIAPPIPCPLLDTISMSGLAARPHSSEPRVKMASPMENTSLRPYRSAREPEVSSSAARV